jgi:solute carrier family 26 (sodium-independent sulfate anion transporter), member 11
MASAADTAKRLGKRVVHAPEDPVPVVSVGDWLSNLTKDPKGEVRRFLARR